MRKIVFVAVALVGLSGCKQCGSGAGYRFEYLKPATVRVEMPVSQASGPIEATPLGVQQLPRMRYAHETDPPMRAQCLPMPKQLPPKERGPCGEE